MCLDYTGAFRNDASTVVRDGMSTTACVRAEWEIVSVWEWGIKEWS